MTLFQCQLRRVGSFIYQLCASHSTTIFTRRPQLRQRPSGSLWNERLLAVTAAIEHPEGLRRPSAVELTPAAHKGAHESISVTFPQAPSFDVSALASLNQAKRRKTYFGTQNPSHNRLGQQCMSHFIDM